MELSPGVMRPFNEIITKDYLLSFIGCFFVIREAVFVFFSFPFSTLSDFVFVSLAVAPFVAGIKSLQGVTRSDWESWGKGGGEKKKRKVKKKKKADIGCCSVVLMCLNMGLIFMPSKHT